MGGHNEAWERVLAAVEADARRAEALLRPVVEDELAAEPAVVVPGAVPAEWLLPATASAETVLPPLSDMPPVPEELRERIETLREQIEGLQAELASAMHELRHPRRKVHVAAAAHQQPVFVDRRL